MLFRSKGAAAKEIQDAKLYDEDGNELEFEGEEVEREDDYVEEEVV